MLTGNSLSTPFAARTLNRAVDLVVAGSSPVTLADVSLVVVRSSADDSSSHHAGLRDKVVTNASS